MTPARFGLIGSGWRAAFFLRVAAALPDRLACAGVLARSTGRREAIARQFSVGTPASLDELLAARPDFVVVSVPWDITPVLLRELTDRRIPVLAETPPAPDLDGLRALAPLARTGRIQVAEQYQFQPFHAARLERRAVGPAGPPVRGPGVGGARLSRRRPDPAAARAGPRAAHASGRSGSSPRSLPARTATARRPGCD